MHFRQYQKYALRLSSGLLWLYLFAVVAIAGITATVTALLTSLYLEIHDGVSIAMHPTVFKVVFIIVLAMVAVAAWIRLRQLSHGGHVVATALGGEQVSRKQARLSERRLLNVVEEIAIASGMHIPRVYILPDMSLNAFAAGMDQRDAVIGITRGAVDAFNRSELQGVIAHEFSHILNGDMRRNMQLCGGLYGLQMLSSLGRFFINVDFLIFRRNLLTMILGGFLLVLGFTGSLVAGWIQAAISRQREFLADASAVQFTRHSEGLASALCKVAVAPTHRLSSPHASEYAHFMFAGLDKADIFDRLAATHPDIYERIQRLSPSHARRWRHKIRKSKEKRAEFVYLPYSTFSFSNQNRYSDMAEQTHPNEHQGRLLAENIHRFDTHAETNKAQLLQFNPKHWLSAEGDSERLTITLSALLTPTALAETEHIWSRRFPLRTAFYQRLQQHPLPQPLHRPLLMHLLPSVTDLPPEEQQSLQNELSHFAGLNGLDAPAALLWLEAAAWLKWFVGPESNPQETQEHNSQTILAALAQWTGEAGRLNTLGIQGLPRILHTLQTYPAHKRTELLTKCRLILAAGDNPDWAKAAEKVVTLYGRP